MKHLLFSFLCSLGGITVAADQPNIVVLLADDHSVLNMSVYGAKDIPTPHLDRMAVEGMVFDRAFVN
ncbi:MAG: sulfatase-like hydrolase/transferase [Verrucomicrobiales bacterium]|nr:sulfatase-like hydrolase/transferase [Verrucomicrobiales bacterium]